MALTPASTTPGGSVPPKAPARPEAAAIAPAPEAATRPREDGFEGASKPENWRIESTTTHEVFERARRAQEGSTVVAGQKVVEDTRQTNLDTGEVIEMHAEEQDDGKASHARQDFRQYDAKGQLRLSSTVTAEEDGAGHSHGQEVITTFGPQGEQAKKVTYEWAREQGRLTREATTEEQ